MNQKPISFMWKKAGLLSLFFLLLVTVSQASSPDSLRVRWINGKKFVLHKVAPKETFSSLSRRYKVTITELQQANPGVSGLKIGQIINVPVGSPSAGSDDPVPVVEKQRTASETSGKAKTHTVQKGETLYRISKLYGMTVDDLKSLNGLTDNAVSIGQKLKVTESGSSPVPAAPVAEVTKAEVPKQETPKPEAPKQETPKTEAPKQEMPKPEAPKEEVPKQETPKAESPKPANGDELPKVYSSPGASRTSTIEKDPKTGLEVEKIVEVGVAAWMNEGDLNQNKFYALHRTAPVGTIIKVTNRMNNNSVFVKVVGLLPETGDNNNFIIKITQAAAQRIGALDQKFTAELSYGISK
jgi:LysM repeat protein